MKKIILFFLICTFTTALHAQLLKEKKGFTKEDTLRGSLNENRDWWDVLRYDITVKPDIENKSIEGVNKITFRQVRKGNSKVQIDLQKPLIVDSITVESFDFKGSLRVVPTMQHKVDFIQDSNLNVVYFDMGTVRNTTSSFIIYYHGQPRIAKFPPWDGGWIWTKDKSGNPWVSVACQGLGASVWYPCKDYQGDEPDNGASLTIVVPDSLVAVGNGRLLSTVHRPSSTEYTWEVKNPINNYEIIPSIGKYVNFTDTLMGEKGKLDLSYWALKEDEEKAKKQFQQVKPMLRAFEYWFGPYPFYEDSYKLIESPHLGMEHQSAVAYGNHFMNGYLGRDLSHSGWGLKWDYIIVHESGHEWFGNNITTKDIADMWVHEGFTCYSETLYTEYYYGKEAGNEYNFGLRKNIRNESTIIGPYGVNKEGSEDMYYKGANMLHTIRHSMNNDSLFRTILRGLNKTFYHQTVTTRQIEKYISTKAKFNYQKVFDQYLRTIQIPALQISIKENQLTYQWTNCIDGFNLPVILSKNNQSVKLFPTTNAKTISLSKEQLGLINADDIKKLYYIDVKINN